MNISHKQLLNNNFSKEKKQFYEKIGNRYYHEYINNLKKYQNKNFKNKVINWLFSKDEETRMILCCVENKKYTKLINEAYNSYKKNQIVKIYLKDDEIEEKSRLIFLEEPKLATNDHNYYTKQRQFLNEIMFYQCESPINDYEKYSNYFTLSNIKDQTSFINFCNEFSNYNFLHNLIKPKAIEQQNKIFNIYFEFPEWLYDNFFVNCDNKYYLDYGYKNNIDINMFYDLPKFILAMIEQTLSIRYIIYSETNNLQEILSSTYLYELMEKRNKIILYLAPKENKFNFAYFKIDELIKTLYQDQKLEEFISKNRVEEEGIFYSDIYFNIDEDLNDLILECNKFFLSFFKNNTPKDFINFFMLIHIQNLFSYDDFYFRGIFEKIYERYSNQTCEDLIYDKKQPAKKRRKKKKKNKEGQIKEETNKINNNNIIDYGEEILKILSESNEIHHKENNSINSINENSYKFDSFKKEKDIKEKIKKEDEDIKNKKNKIENIKKENEESLIFEYIKNLLYDYLFKNIDIKENLYIKNDKKKKKKLFFLYETNKSQKKKKNSIEQNNKEQNIDNNSKLKQNININKEEFIVNNKTIKNNDKDNNKIHKENDNIIDENIKLNAMIKEKNNEDEKKDEAKDNKSNKSIISHINSLTFKSIKNEKKEKNEGNIFINNNIINININNNLVLVYNTLESSLDKLHNDIIEYYNDLEEVLQILRQIKDEIVNYLSLIIQQIIPDCKLLVYGSSLYHLDIDTSDLDLSISTELNISLAELEKYLLEHNEKDEFDKINAILSASVPIIKFEIDYLKINNEKINNLYELLKSTKYYKIFYKKNKDINYLNRINVDISINSANNKQLEFIKEVLNDYPNIKPIIKIIKKILQIKEMNNPYKGGMSSYCLFLLIYSYINFFYNKLSKRNNTNFDYGTLLIGILYYYYAFIDFSNTIIAPYLSNPFISNCPLDSIPTIIEPISRKNAGKSIFKIFDIVNFFYQIYQDIYNLMKENNGNNLIYELIKKYIEK